MICDKLSNRIKKINNNSNNNNNKIKNSYPSCEFAPFLNTEVENNDPGLPPLVMLRNGLYTYLHTIYYDSI